PPLALTIRFSASVPDLDLDIPYPSTTTVISLKHLIRSRLTEPNSQRRLRFIQAGKILPDGAVLSSVLRAPSAPPPSDADYTSSRGGSGGNGSAKGKGKAVLGRLPALRIYVNCSIGDSLTSVELEEEARAAAEVPPTTTTAHNPSPTTTSSLATSRPAGAASLSPLHTPGTPIRSTTTAPRGFDRLLSAGFSTAEVNQLRLQFRSIHSSRFTPDTLPSPDSFRRMEDAWIDDNGGSMPTMGSGGSGTATTAGGFDSEDVGIASHIDALIWGVMTGFMWPLGSFGWLMREPGLHSDRWRFMVGVGFVFTLLIGIVRGISGD
ncbi:DUF2407 C-terminal domain-containing protein, partial [Pseudomassariella vexata]